MTHSVTISWTASATPGVTYNVYRDTNPPGNPGSSPINTSPITGTSYVDNAVTPGEKVGYIVTAVDNGIESVHSNEPVVTVPVAAPTVLTASIVNGNQASLSWSESDSGVTYNVYKGGASGQEGTTPIATGLTSPSFTDPVQYPLGTSVFYEVTAVENGTESARSNEASVVFLPQPPTNVEAAAV